MNSFNEPIYYSETFFLGKSLEVTFRGEDWGTGILDTSVKIGGEIVCWITWKDKKEFMKELNEVITKYCI